MIRHQRQYRIPTYQEVMESDTGTKMDIPSFDDVMGSGEISKKKEVSPYPLLYKGQKGLPLLDLKSRSENPLSAKENVAGVSKALQNRVVVDHPLTDEEAQNIALDEINQSAKENFDQNDPLKSVLYSTSNKQYLDEHGNVRPPDIKVFGQKLKLLANAFPTAASAKQYLGDAANYSTEEMQKAAGTNVTKQAAVKKVADLREVENAFKTRKTLHSDLENAALNYAAEHGDESIKYLLDKGQPIPESARGPALLNFVSNPQLNELAESNPQLKTEIKEAISNLPSTHPESAAKILAEFIAKKRDEKGLNSVGLNLPQKEDTDKIMKELIDQKIIPANYQFVYEKEIRPKLGTLRGVGRLLGNAIPIVNKAVNENPIPTPGVVENVIKGAENAETGIAKSVMDLTGLGGMFETQPQQTARVLKEQSSQPAYEPKNFLHQLSMHGGEMIPFVASLAGGSAALNATNLIKSPELATAAMMILGTHGDAVDKSRTLFPGKPLQQYTYVNVMDALNASMAKFLPGAKIGTLLKNGEPEIQSIVKDLASGKLDTEAAKNSIVDWLGKTAKGTLHGAEFMGATAAADDLLTQVLQGKNVDLSKSLEKGWEGAKLGLISTPFIAGAEAALRSNKGYRNEIVNFAENPEYYKNLTQLQAAHDPEFAKMKEDILTNLDHLSNVWNEVKGNDKIKEKDKVQYLINSFNENVKKKQADATTDPTIKKQLQDDAKDLHEVKEGLLNGIPEEKVKENQAIKEVKDMYNSGYLTQDANSLLESKKTEESEPKFDEDKVKSFLQYVAENPQKKYPSKIVEIANEMFPQEEKPVERKSTSVIMPEENKTAEPISLNKTEQNAIQEPSTSSVLQHPQEGTGETGGGRERMESGQQGNEIAGTLPEEKGQSAGEEKPPVSEPPIPNRQYVHIEYPATQLSHGGVTRIGTEHEFEPENKYEKSSVLKWNKEADELMDKGFSVQNLLQKVDAGEHIPNPAERVVLTRYAAELEKRLRDIKDTSNPDFDATLKELQRVANVANFAGSQTGASLGAIGHIKVVPNGSYAEFMLNELNANNDAPLTDAQKKTANYDYEKLELARKRLEEDEKAFEEKKAAFKAEQEYGNIKKTSKKGDKKDYKSERDKIVGDILLKFSKASGEGASFLGAKELASIAPDILKLAKSFAEQGIEKLSEVVDNIHELLKEKIPDLEKKNIHDIIAGEYNEKKQTKKDAAIRMENLRIEAQLINRLEKLERGEEPKKEKEKVKRNQEIDSLRKRIKEFQKSKAEGDEFYGEEKDLDYKRLEAIKNRNEKETEKLKEKIAKGDFAPEEKKTPLMQNKELQKKYPELFKKAQDSFDNYVKAKREIAIRRLKQMYENKTPQEKTIEVFSKTLNIPRTLMASFDFSAPLRQGIIASIGHPIMANRALKFMFDATKNEKVYNRWLEDVHNDPRWEAAKKTGLGISDPESLHVKEKEEAFQGAPYAEKIPIIGAGVKASERAYIGYLNHLRWNLFNMYADRFEEQGKTYENNPKLYEGLSSMINSETGRGGLKGLENAAPVLNWFLFASKLIASRLNMLGLSDVPNLAIRGATLGKYGIDYGFYSKLPKELRIEAAKDMLKFIATGIGVLAMAKGISNASGGNIEVEIDPRSSDFGKIKSGNTRWDIWGGFQPYARVITQSLTGQTKSTTTGDIKNLDNRLIPLGRFARQKLAPVPGAAFNLIEGHDATGQQVSIPGQLLQNVTPLLIQDVYSAMQDQGIKALFTVGIPSAFGVGTQTYGNNNQKTSSFERPHKKPAERTNKVANP